MMAVIVGAGPVGLMLSTCLARWGYRVKHVDNRPEPTKTGRADGIQPRTLDLLRNMGLKAELMAHKPARVYEVAFWNPDQSGNDIIRTGTWATCPSFIDARYPFTTLLHQGHIENVFINDLERNGVQIQRPWTITHFKSDERDKPEYPVRVDLKHVDGTATETVRAKYLFGGEGSRSLVRQLLNIGVKHIDPIQHVWGVMDGVVNTDFPDIKVCNRVISSVDMRSVHIESNMVIVDEMYHTQPARFYHGHSSRRQHGSTLHPNCLVRRTRLESKKDGYIRAGTRDGKKDSVPVYDRLGARRVVFSVSHWARNLGQVQFRSARISGR